MEIDHILICIFFISIFAIIFLCVKYVPIWIIKRRGKRYRIFINSKDANDLIRMGCVSSTFFRLCSLFIDEDINFDIIELAHHHVSGGNLEAVLSSLLYSKKNQIIVSYSEIYTLDLAKKDIIETLKKGKPYF